MSVLTLVRHGQASYMSEDYDRLSSVGEEQARKLGEFWVQQETAFDLVFHGPAKRHIRTFEIASAVVQDAGRPLPEPVLVEAMDEFDAYQMMKTMVPLLSQDDEQIRRLNEQFRENQSSPEAGRLLQYLFEAVCRRWCSGEFDAAGSESWKSFCSRVGRAIDHIKNRVPRSARAVVITSGGPIAATVGNVLDLTPSKTVEFIWLSRNCSYSEFFFNAERMSLSSFNAIPHLQDRSLITYR